MRESAERKPRNATQPRKLSVHLRTFTSGERPSVKTLAFLGGSHVCLSLTVFIIKQRHVGHTAL